MLGIFKPFPLSPKFVFVGHCFPALEKLLHPRYSNFLNVTYFLETGGTSVSSSLLKLVENSETFLGQDNNY